MKQEEVSDRSCLEKQAQIKRLFADCHQVNARYEKLIELGRQQAPLEEKFKTAENKVEGCQSEMYLHSYMKEGLVFFEAQSDALISNGLAALLIKVYSGEPPEVILRCPPTYIDELHIATGLSANRVNGLYSLHLRMKQEALRFLMEKKQSS